MTSFSIPFDRDTGESDVTALLGEHAREEAVRVDAEVARTDADLPIPC